LASQFTCPLSHLQINSSFCFLYSLASLFCLFIFSYALYCAWHISLFLINYSMSSLLFFLRRSSRSIKVHINYSLYEALYYYYYFLRVLRVFLIPIQSQDPRVTGVQWLIKVNFAFVIKKFIIFFLPKNKLESKIFFVNFKRTNKFNFFKIPLWM
jgi:hypothetical protein